MSMAYGERVSEEIENAFLAVVETVPAAELQHRSPETTLINVRERVYDALDLSPHSDTSVYLSAAFQDAGRIILYAGRTVAAEQPTLPVGSALLESKVHLTQPVRLHSPVNHVLMNEIRLQSKGKPGRGPLMEVVDPDTGKLNWTAAAQEILQSGGKEFGRCPAARRILEVEGKKQLVVHYFWDRLVTLAYGADKV